MAEGLVTTNTTRVRLDVNGNASCIEGESFTPSCKSDLAIYELRKAEALNTVRDPSFRRLLDQYGAKAPENNECTMPEDLRSRVRDTLSMAIGLPYGSKITDLKSDSKTGSAVNEWERAIEGHLEVPGPNGEMIRSGFKIPFPLTKDSGVALNSSNPFIHSTIPIADTNKALQLAEAQRLELYKGQPGSGILNPGVVSQPIHVSLGTSDFFNDVKTAEALLAGKTPNQVSSAPQSYLAADHPNVRDFDRTLAARYVVSAIQSLRLATPEIQEQYSGKLKTMAGELLYDSASIIGDKKITSDQDIPARVRDLQKIIDFTGSTQTPQEVTRGAIWIHLLRAKFSYEDAASPNYDRQSSLKDARDNYSQAALLAKRMGIPFEAGDPRTDNKLREQLKGLKQYMQQDSEYYQRQQS